MEKEAFTNEEVKQFTNTFSKLSTDKLVSIFGYSYKRQTEKYIQWGWDYRASTKKCILNDWFLKNQDNCMKKNLADLNNYSTMQLINDLMLEIQKLSEELAFLFPNRIIKERTSFGIRKLAEYWCTNEDAVAVRLNLIKKKPNFPSTKNMGDLLKVLEDKIVQKIGAKALGCKFLFKKFRNNEISSSEFIDSLLKELGRVTGEIKLNVEEAGLILGGTSGFIKAILSRINNPSQKKVYNPDYKFSIERLDEMIDNLKRFFGDFRARKCIDLIEKYKQAKNLKEYFRQQHNVKNPHFFQKIDNQLKAYWFGFLCADGWLISKRYDIGLELQKTDRKVLIKFAEAIGLDLSSNDIKDRFRIHFSKCIANSYQTSYIRFVCRSMYEDLINIGFSSSKAERKTIPLIIKNIIKRAKEEAIIKKINWKSTNLGQIACAWLLGVFDGDGCYRGERSGIIFSSSRHFLEGIKSHFDIKNKILTNVEPGTERLIFDKVCIRKGFYLIYLGSSLLEFMWESYSNSLDRKRV